MATASEYRQFAKECLRWATEAETEARAATRETQPTSPPLHRPPQLVGGLFGFQFDFRCWPGSEAARFENCSGRF